MKSSFYDIEFDDCVIYFDRVWVWLEVPLDDESIEMARAVSGAAILVINEVMYRHLQYRQRIDILHPTQEQLRVLQAYISDVRTLTNYSEPAYNHLTISRIVAKELHEAMDAAAIKKYQRSGKVRYRPVKIDDVDEFGFVTTYSNRRRSRSNHVCYSDKFCKLTGSAATHNEIRLRGKKSNQLAGIMKFSDLADFDIVSFLRKRLDFYIPRKSTAEKIGRDLMRKQLGKTGSRRKAHRGSYLTTNKAKRIGTLVLRGRQSNPDRFDASEIKLLGRQLGINLLRHFDKLDPAEVFPAATR
jgi:hypothetical protein